MKPFNLEEALNGKPVITREGRKVTIIGKGPDGFDYPLSGYIEGLHVLETWTLTGNFVLGQKPNKLDLFMGSETKEGWVAFGSNYDQEQYGLVGFCTHVWPTEGQAKVSFHSATGHDCYGTQKVTWEV